MGAGKGDAGAQPGSQQRVSPVECCVVSGRCAAHETCCWKLLVKSRAPNGVRQGLWKRGGEQPVNCQVRKSSLGVGGAVDSKFLMDEHTATTRRAGTHQGRRQCSLLASTEPQHPAATLRPVGAPASCWRICRAEAAHSHRQSDLHGAPLPLVVDVGVHVLLQRHHWHRQGPVP